MATSVVGFTELLHSVLARSPIEKQFDDACLELLSAAQLPYNPYPFLVNRFFFHDERHRLDVKAESEIMQMFRADTKTFNSQWNVARPILVHPSGSDFVCGLKPVIQSISAECLWQYKWIITQLTPKPTDTLTNLAGYSCQVMVALFGQAVFHGKIYQTIHSIDARLEYIITGYDVAQGLDLFASYVVNDVKRMENLEMFFLLGVYVPYFDTEADMWKHRMWIYQDIISRQAEFADKVKKAVVEHKLIFSKYLCSTDSEGTRIAACKKEYVLTFIQIGQTLPDSDRVVIFCEESSGLTLREAVFFSLGQAESHLSAHSNRTGNTTSESKRDLLEPFDGLRIPAFDEMSFQESTTLNLEKRLASMQLESDPFLVIHNLILLLIFEEETNHALLGQLYTLARCRAYRLFGLLQLNNTIRILLYRINSHHADDKVASSNVTMFHSMFESYRQDTLQFLENDLDSPYEAGWRQVIMSKLTELSTFYNTEKNDVFQATEVMRLVKNLYSYTFTIYLVLLKNVLESCGEVENKMNALTERHPDEAAAAARSEAFHFYTKRQMKSDDSPIASDDDALPITKVYKHGYEDDAIKQHSRTVIDVDGLVHQFMSEMLPSYGRKAILAKYVVECHLDQTWHDFLINTLDRLMSKETPAAVDLSEFPGHKCYQELLTCLLRGSVKMDLCHLTDDTLNTRLRSSSDSIQSVASVNGCMVYQLVPHNIFGSDVCLQLLDGPVIGKLLKVVSPLFSDEDTVQYGPHHVTTCCCLSGKTLLYGKFDPYLPAGIELVEHCYIRGSDAQWVNAVQLYTKLVFKQLSDVSQRNELFIDGIYFGSDQSPWSVADVIGNKSGFTDELEHRITTKQPVFIRAFVQIDWRLIPVDKYLVMYYSSIQQPESTILFSNSGPGEMYRSVFTSAEKAIYHFKHARNFAEIDPQGLAHQSRSVARISQQLSSCKEKCEWHEMYGLLLWKSAIQQDLKSTAVAWRLFHSVVRCFHYLIDLCKSLQDLIRYMMSVAEDEVDWNLLETISVDMLNGLQTKVSEVCREPRSLVPNNVMYVLLGKLTAVDPRDPDGTLADNIADLRTILILDEVIEMLMAVRDHVAASAHEGLLIPQSDDSEKNSVAGQLRRSRSVESVYLRDDAEITQSST